MYLISIRITVTIIYLLTHYMYIRRSVCLGLLSQSPNYNLCYEIVQLFLGRTSQICHPFEQFGPGQTWPGHGRYLGLILVEIESRSETEPFINYGKIFSKEVSE